MALVSGLLSAQAFGNPVLNCVLDWFDDHAYLEGACPSNVCALLEEAETQSHGKVDLKKARVVYVTSDDQTVHAYSTRDGAYREWGFHVFLEYEGKVYDLDAWLSFSGIPLETYLQKMYLPESSDRVPPQLESLHFMSIPASDYLTQFGHMDSEGHLFDHNYYAYSQAAHARYKTGTLESALSDGVPPLPHDVFPPPSLSTMLEPRIALRTNSLGMVQKAQWRDRDFVTSLQGATGKILVFRISDGHVVNDPARVARFVEALRRMAPKNPGLQKLINRYDETNR
jgi:hypothetical protein